MAILDFFKSKEKAKPLVKGFSLSSFSTTYDTSLTLFYEFYERNPYISSVVDKIRWDVGAHWYEIRRFKKENEAIMEEFSKLINISVGYTPRQFIKRIMRDYEVTGNAYVYVAKDWTKTTGIQILDPRYMKPIMLKTWQVIGYVQNLGWYRYFTKDEVFHLKSDTDLELEAIGRSKMESLFIDLETDKEARDSNLAFFHNNQTPASYVLLDPEFAFPENAEDEAKLRKEMKEIFESGKYAGGKNRHRASIMQGVKEVVKVQDKLSDMEFLNMRKFTLELVCSVYGVNKDVLWFTDTSNRSVWGVQSETYYFMIEEKEDMIDEFMTDVIQAVFWTEYSYVTIKDNLRTLIVKGELSTNLYEKGVITLNEARELLQYEKVDETKWGDDFKKPEPKVDPTKDPAADTKPAEKKKK